MFNHILNLPYSRTCTCPMSLALSSPQLIHLPSSLVSSSHITLAFHFLVLPYHTMLLLTPPHLVLCNLTSSLTPASPIPHLQLYFNQPSAPPPSILSFPILSHANFHVVSSYAVSLQQFPYPTSLHSILLALFYPITSWPILPHSLSHSALYHLFLSYTTSSPTFPPTSPLSCPILFCLIQLHLPYHSVSLHLLLPHPTSSLTFSHFILSCPTPSYLNHLPTLFQTLFQTSRSVSSPFTLSHFILTFPHLTPSCPTLVPLRILPQPLLTHFTPCLYLLQLHLISSPLHPSYPPAQPHFILLTQELTISSRVRLYQKSVCIYLNSPLKALF